MPQPTVSSVLEGPYDPGGHICVAVGGYSSRDASRRPPVLAGSSRCFRVVLVVFAGFGFGPKSRLEVAAEGRYRYDLPAAERQLQRVAFDRPIDIDT